MKKLFGFIFVFISYFFFAQEAEKKDSVRVENEIVTDIELLHNKKTSYSGLNPTKAGWRSAIIPGWGQYYNRKYWKIPIVWGAIGTGVGFIIGTKNNTKDTKMLLKQS